ncbi:MAG: hypothetical protein JSU85_01070 [Candidatus Zixiibacteriota bacterium]|nr:MAG: hypothetical protein JSU85_01070 [candidate division Zixibacteria bacterium]
MKKGRSRLFDAFILGLGSIATQTVYIKLILSSQVGGELYAALAIGGWIASAATGAFLGSKIKDLKRSTIWLLSAVFKIPLAFFVFIYPSFFTGVLDPLRFLPLVLIGIAPSGILYGLLFPLLITNVSKTSTVYRNEAVGSITGGLLMVVLSYLGIGGFTVLFLLSGIEISRILFRRLSTSLIPAVFFIVGFYIGPQLDKAGLDIRWPGFHTVKTAHGFSGLWALHSREKQFTVTYNGEHLQTIPDRQSAEEALLWPFLYNPEARDMLLIGFEGIEAEKYLPEGVRAKKLITDKAFLKLGVQENADYMVVDPLSYSSDTEYDIVNILLNGGGDLSDNRFETGFFFEKYADMLKSDGVLYVSAVSDENYIAPELGHYLSAIKNTLDDYFESVFLIPGYKIGFVCSRGADNLNPVESLSKLQIDSPYFNETLIANRLAPFRIARLQSQITDYKTSNNILKPSSVIYYLQWIGSMFGRSKYLFRIYLFPYPLLFFPMLILIPLTILIFRKSDFLSLLSITLLGSLGMASEIAAIYLFQILFGYLYLLIGLIIAVFMAGMALGAHYGSKLKPYAIMGPILLCFTSMLFLPHLIESGIGLKITLFLLYILATASGFCSGGGFAKLAERDPGDRRFGATLYGADLYGAMAATVLVPGILIAFGVAFLFWSLIVIGLIISATLWYLLK